MTLADMRQAYGIPATKGMAVRVVHPRHPQPLCAVIVGTYRDSLKVMEWGPIPRGRVSQLLHWNPCFVQYLDDHGAILWDGCTPNFPPGYHPDMAAHPTPPPGMGLVGPMTGGDGFIMWVLTQRPGQDAGSPSHLGEITYYPDDEPNPWKSYTWPTHEKSPGLPTAAEAVAWLLRGLATRSDWQTRFPEFDGPPCPDCITCPGIDVSRRLHSPPASLKWHPPCQRCFGTGRLSPWVAKGWADVHRATWKAKRGKQKNPIATPFTQLFLGDVSPTP
jgi:hypothetical protein